MAKNMARIESGIVTNIEWRSDFDPETEDTKNLNDLVVVIGDTYTDGKFYRDGEEVLSPLEYANKKNEELSSQIENLVAAMAQLVEDVYSQDVE